ncbi:MAG: phage major capsid protein [Dorea sp.]|jgi:HK97 family phage major capsid protein|uniref:phage major capsid protein n=1 Tax=Dorea sp. TaxID=2040332 RepID=UPI0020680617|nr:phage major capsid protein [Dorea sp.]MDR3925433.1 phage major capsid protein [Dorea sp.]DAZ79753.1 MAG TPA: major capsid protein [Caudoviricetes sp.]
MLGNIADTKQREAVAALQSALQSGNEEEGKKAWGQVIDAITEKVKTDFEMYSTDTNVLAQRGYRQLTSEETKFYQNLAKAGKASDPKQAFTDLINTDGGMPETIIEDVYRDLLEEHPLLDKITFQNVKYLTKWLLNDHTRQKAAWGQINGEITQEIESAFKGVEVALLKLTAYAVIPQDMLDLGPSFLDNYIRTILKEALYAALEKAIVSGSGKDEPVGLNRDIHEGVSFSTSTGYPEKTAIQVTNFLPANYGPLVAKLAVTEKGRMRSFDEVLMICNQVDYLNKIMPATTALTTGGTYARDLFPFPTEVVRSNEVKTGQAILCLPEEYFFGLGESKDGKIEYSDEFKFLQDARTYKIKLHGNGRPYDNTVAIVLDISKLDPAYVTVKTADTVVTA